MTNKIVLTFCIINDRCFVLKRRHYDGLISMKSMSVKSKTTLSISV